MPSGAAPTLLAEAGGEAGRWSVPGRVLAVLAGSLILAVSAQIQVPSWPVPTTLQSLAVVGLGIVLGPRLGAAAVVAYLAEGAAGLPVFAGLGRGVGHLAGPTGGYLFGFVAAAWLAGLIAGPVRQAGWARAFLAMCVGHAVLLTTGAAWLTVFVGPVKAVALGVTPFLIGSAVKSALGAACCHLVRTRP